MSKFWSYLKGIGGKNDDASQDNESSFFCGREVDKDGYTLGNINQDVYREYLDNSKNARLEYHRVDEPVIMTQPGNIHEVRLSDKEISKPEVFWGQHGRTIDDYTTLAKDIPRVQEHLERGEDVKSLSRDPELGACAGLYFDPDNAVKVYDYKGTYMMDSDGRHRIMAAQLVGSEIPVRVIGRYTPCDIEPSESKNSTHDIKFYTELTPEERRELQIKQMETAKKYREEHNLDEHGQPIEPQTRPSGGIERERVLGTEDPRRTEEPSKSEPETIKTENFPFEYRWDGYKPNAENEKKDNESDRTEMKSSADQPKVLQRDATEQWIIGTNAIDARMDLRRDDLRDKGMKDGPEMEGIIAEERKEALEELRNDIEGVSKTDPVTSDSVELKTRAEDRDNTADSYFSGTVDENARYGEGGANQYFVPNANEMKQDGSLEQNVEAREVGDVGKNIDRIGVDRREASPENQEEFDQMLENTPDFKSEEERRDYEQKQYEFGLQGESLAYSEEEIKQLNPEERNPSENLENLENPHDTKGLDELDKLSELDQMDKLDHEASDELELKGEKYLAKDNDKPSVEDLDSELDQMDLQDSDVEEQSFEEQSFEEQNFEDVDNIEDSKNSGFSEMSELSFADKSAADISEASFSSSEEGDIDGDDTGGGNLM